MAELTEIKSIITALLLLSPLREKGGQKGVLNWDENVLCSVTTRKCPCSHEYVLPVPSKTFVSAGLKEAMGKEPARIEIGEWPRKSFPDATMAGNPNGQGQTCSVFKSLL